MVMRVVSGGGRPVRWSRVWSRMLSNRRVVTIGDVSVETKGEVGDWERVPRGHHVEEELGDQQMLGHLRWMMQKDKLGQDVFLLGPPGKARRRLAMRYGELLEREVEYLAVSRDTTESDLKQRREIVDGTGLFVDQAPVRAATHGRLLIIEGIEKAERNVLPTLNNLLENREMQLDDGRFLMHASRYDELLEKGVITKRSEEFVRAHPDFRVIAIGLPVPPFKGKPLDPPLRSRFQVRVIDPLSPGNMWGSIVSRMSDVDPSVGPHSEPGTFPRVMHLLSAANSLRLMEEEPFSGSSKLSGASQMTELLHFPEGALPELAALAHAFPLEPVGSLLNRAYPFFGDMPTGVDMERNHKACRLLLKQQQQELCGPGAIVDSFAPGSDAYRLDRIHGDTFSFTPTNAHLREQREASVTLRDAWREATESPQAERDPWDFAGSFHAVDRHKSLLTAMAQDHLVGRDVLLIGEAGCGKSRIAEQFAKVLGRNCSLFSLYKDISARDLLQRRVTDNKGNTGWDDSALVKAAVQGDVLILDGIDRVDPETLCVIQRLVEDREADLFDGRVLRPAHFSGGDETAGDGPLRVHPGFRVIALATSSVSASGRSTGGSASKPSKWLTSDILSMFSAHYLPPLDPVEQELVLRSSFSNLPPDFFSVLRNFCTAMAQVPEKRREQQGVHGSSSSSSNSADQARSQETFAESLGLKPLSMRQVMRLARFADAFPVRAQEEMRERLRNVLLAHFLPSAQKQRLEQLMDQVGVAPEREEQLQGDAEGDDDDELEIITDGHTLRIGDVETTVSDPTHPELVPSPLFFPIPRHKQVLRDILEDILSNERHILLIGNQGVGKNLLTEALLQLLHREREYIQLHRDSTVGSLTLSPGLRDGVIVWEDSPLVRAVIHGRVLMVDEIDKAPLEVVSVLKGIIEDGEMLLADGRKLVSAERFDAVPENRRANLVRIHPEFSIFALANRPGWPFQGNSFFREIGDVFSSHVISNPDARSELALLTAYAPNVDTTVLRKLVAAFRDLRLLVLDGVLEYPYSARECVAIAKHMQAYPQDGLVKTLENVLGFDNYSPQLLKTIEDVFQKHDIPYQARNRDGSSENAILTINVAENREMPPAVPTESWQRKTKDA